MLATVAAADSASTVRKKYRVFLNSEAEPYAMYAIYKQTLTLCVLQFLYYDRYVFVHPNTCAKRSPYLSPGTYSIDHVLGLTC